MNIFEHCFKVKSQKKNIDEQDIVYDEVINTEIQSLSILFGADNSYIHINSVQDLLDIVSLPPIVKEYTEDEMLAPLSARIDVQEVLTTKYPTIPLSINYDMNRSSEEERDVLKACAEISQKYVWEITKLQPKNFQSKDKLWNCPICNVETRKLERSHVGKSRLGIIRDVLKAYPRERNISRLIFLAFLIMCRHEIVMCCGKCSTSLESVNSLSYYIS